jgi:hypothetical protein
MIENLHGSMPEGVFDVLQEPASRWLHTCVLACCQHVTLLTNCCLLLVSAACLQVGRTARPRGDGSFEFSAPPSNLGSKGSATLQAVQEATVNTFSVQSFTELNAVTWERSSALTKLLTIATVCNKAKFTFGEEQQCELLCDVLCSVRLLVLCC